MVLEAFWKGDIATLETIADDGVAREFAAAIDERKAAGLTLENRLVRIDKTAINEASLKGRVAQVTFRYDADLVAGTRNAAGEAVAGATSDAVATPDVWTYARRLRASDS